MDLRHSVHISGNQGQACEESGVIARGYACTIDDAVVEPHEVCTRRCLCPMAFDLEAHEIDGARVMIEV